MSSSCVVVGAGLAGLVAARSLAGAGWQVQVFDKGRAVGGRMATRRISGGTFDHGAQFFTVRHELFEHMVASWQEAGVVRQWSHGFEPRHHPDEPEGFPRYIGIPGMTAIPKLLARGLEVHCGTGVAAVRRSPSTWQVELENNATLQADALLLTPPAPQVLALLQAGEVELAAADRQVLEQITYEPCLCLLALLDGPSQLPAPGAVQLGSEPVAWIADNAQKGISGKPAVTIHAGPIFSQEHWQDDDQSLARQLLGAAHPWLGAAAVQHQVKRWRYSRPLGLTSTPCLALSSQPTLLVAGDAFGGPRVEGAVLSGLAAAELIWK